MGWDEKIFHWGLGKFERVFSARGDLSDNREHAVELAEIHARLKILASALVGRSLEIKEAESTGGNVGDTIFLPRVMSLAPSREDNIQAFLYRTVYSSILAEHRVQLPQEFRDQPKAQLLMSLMAVPLVRSEIQANYSGLLTVEKELFALESERRLKRHLKRGGSGLGEATALWVRSLLEEDASPLSDLVLPRVESFTELEKGVRDALPLWKHELGDKSRGADVMPVLWSLILPTQKSLGSAKDTDGTMPSADVESLPTGTERKGKPKENVEEVHLKEDDAAENPLGHVFEKVQTLDEFAGGRKALDGSDELAEQLEALEELDLRKLIRSRERTDSLYRSDVMLESGAGQFEDVSQSTTPDFLYDEWDIGRKAYRPRWCKLYLDRTDTMASADKVDQFIKGARIRNRRQILELRQQFESMTDVRRWRTREQDGPEIDIDAVVDYYATVKSGHSGQDALYLSQRPRDRDFASLVLLDSSLSTDAWVKNHRVMDVVREAMWILGEVSDEFQDRLAIGAFFSNTRNDCRYVEVKKMNESWAHCQPALVGLRPRGYTRIGPALRHGTHLLKQVQARKKLLLLISDGKPTDYDRYEGRYGIEDIRQAIREAGQDHITVRALAIDSQAKFYLPQMFGTGNYEILPDPALLARTLSQIYGRLSA